MSASNLQRKLDADRFERLHAGMAKIRASLGQFVDPTCNKAFMRLWYEAEQIKQRYHGMPPTTPQPQGHGPKEK